MCKYMKYALKELPMLICKDIVDRKSHTKEKCAHIREKERHACKCTNWKTIQDVHTKIRMHKIQPK